MSQLLQVAFEQGQMAATRGEPLDACSYRRPDKRASWVRGWHTGREQSSAERLSTTERAEGRARMDALRASLAGGK